MKVDFYINKIHGGKTCGGAEFIAEYIKDVDFEESQKENLEAQIGYLNVFIDMLSESMEEFNNERR